MFDLLTWKWCPSHMTCLPMFQY